jgi:predicted CXXCH cytochrome family protein
VRPCHNRQSGADAIGGDHPLSVTGEWPKPGISRKDFLEDHTSRAGPALSDYWADATHSKSHHQQYPDFVSSAHYRNEKILVGCSDCHDMHGGHSFERALVADPHAPDSPLCMNCHGNDLPSTAVHTQAMLGAAHGAATASCIDCHMNKTAKTGSGEFGFLLSAPTGTSADSTETYFENDISSHVFDVPRKTNPGVEGVEPQSAMPIPYTQSCGTCHDPAFLQNL